MKKKKKNSVGWMVPGVSLLLGTFVVVAACSDGLGGWLVSDQDEVDIGVGVDQQIAQEYILVSDSDPVAAWARELVAQLEGSSAQFRDPAEFGGYKTKVIYDNEMVNAFAAPGGYVYITTALVLNAGTCAEIGGVMGHELAHVALRHSIKQIEGTFAVETIASWFLGEGLTKDVIDTLYGVVTATTFSQDHEREADDYGVQVAYGAGYNPFGLVDFFEKLMALEANGGSYIPQFLSSHPATEERVQNVTARIQQLYGGQVVRGQSPPYDCVGTALQLADVQALILSGNISTQ